MGSILSSLFGRGQTVANLDSETFEKMINEIDDAVILDVRTQDEYKTVRIPNSILIDIYKPTFLGEIEKLDRNKTYFIYCRSGSRSHHAAVQMQKMDFEKVYNLESGIIQWFGPVENN
ncbi:MAG: rhodanese-like domain-containing protein [Melioribacteraceae bacterium]|nr:rhodanese-like domain-containing protein [Melioribacteraceae bacterium]